MLAENYFAPHWVVDRYSLNGLNDFASGEQFKLGCIKISAIYNF